MTTRFHHRALIACAGLLAALPLAAVHQPHDTPLHEKTFESPDLYIGSAALAPDTLATPLARAETLGALGVSTGGAFVDPRSGRWATLMLSTPLVPGTGNAMRWADLAATGPRDVPALGEATWNAFSDWLGAHADALGVDPAEVAAPGKVSVQRGGDLIHIYAARRVNGLAVRGSYVTATVSHGNLVLFGAVKWGEVLTPRLAQIDDVAALQAVDSHLGSLAGELTWSKRDLLYVPVARGADPRRVSIGEGYGYRLVWALRGKVDGDPAVWEALVDANDSTLLSFADQTTYATTREVQGGVLPVSNDGVAPDGIEQTYPLPFADVVNGGTTLFTDRGGNLGACLDGSIETTLTGQYVQMVDNCGALSESTTGDVLDLGTSAGTDCAVPAGASAGNTHSSRSGFYELNRSMAIGRSYLPNNSFLNGELTANMNINLVCNATSGGPVVNFYRSGGGCANTGEIAGVFDHEWGHSVDFGDAVPGTSSPSEGIADIYAAQNLHTSCIGRNFRLGNNCGGYGDPCTQCDGVRDIDWANRASGQPHTLTWIDNNCNPGNVNGPCGGSTHCEGAAYAEAVWDLWHRDLTAAPYNFDAQRASELTALLTWGGATNVGNWFTCTNGSGGDGCNADGGYLNYLAADDDDGNLANGTPHMQAIAAAFSRHGIDCPTPTVQDSGCAGAPTTAPTLNATPIDRGMQLSWTSVPGADTYRVFRTEGVFACDFGKELIAEVTGTSFTDGGLNNAMEYSYLVIPVGSSATCYGPASSCVSQQPAAGANLGVPALTPQVAIQGGDGDDFVDSCELATLSFRVDNTGAVTSDNVRIADVRSPSHPHLDDAVSWPATLAASLAPCGQATGSFSFTAFDIAFGDVIVFEVDVTSDQMAGVVSTQTFTLRFVESDLQTVASRTFTFEADTEAWAVEEGIFTRTGAFGGGDGTSFALASSNGVNGVCDKVRSPAFVPSALTTMSLWSEMNMESGNWDRTNAALVAAADGSRTVVAPDGGRAYNESGNPDYAACNEGEDGWGDILPWAASSWSAGALGSAGIAGDLMQIEITHATDVAAVGTGFRFDQVTLTNIDLQVADAQANCADPSLFTDDFESGNLGAWSQTVP
ncbi:MAG: hypothetical protein AAGC60_19125 [Acidobacteriota bacterium]